MGITIKELSEISGFSTATISRVISKQGNVKEETKIAIEKLLIEHNYRSNILDLKKSEFSRRTIMIIVGDLDNWYYMESIRAVNHHLLEKGYVPIIGFSNNEIELEEKYVQVALQENYAGIAFINVRGNDNLQKILERNDCPVVFLNREIKLASFDAVCSDNYHGGYMATSYLIEMGHKKIGHLMGSIYSNTASERRRGYEDAMRNRGLVVTENSVYHGDLDWKSGYKFGEILIQKGLDYTAIFSSGYQMAEGLLRALSDYGVKVPEDISIVTFDSTPATKKENLTTACAEPEKIGKTAVELLVKRIEGETREAQKVYFESKILVGASVRKLME